MLTIVYLGILAATFIIGWRLQYKAFAPAPPAGQASAVVFAQDPSASLTLTASVNPDEPWRDRLIFSMTGGHNKQDHWLLVISCPPRSAQSRHPGTLIAEPATQAPAPAPAVTVYSGAGPHGTEPLGCFRIARSNALSTSKTPGYASIGAVTLPALETDAAIDEAETAPTLYASQRVRAGQVHLVEAFPGAACPPAPAAASTTSSPAPGIPGCFDQAPAGTAFGAYYLPATVQTTEVLSHVDLTGYQVESTFPTPQITNGRGAPGQLGDEQYSWSQASSVSPSLIVSNLGGQQTASRYTFAAGILFGVAGGVAPTLLEKLWNQLPERWRGEGHHGRPRRTPPAEDQGGASHPEPAPEGG